MGVGDGKGETRKHWGQTCAMTPFPRGQGWLFSVRRLSKAIAFLEGFDQPPIAV